jgi:hypothetical protein
MVWTEGETIHKFLSQDRQCQGQDSNPASPDMQAACHKGVTETGCISHCILNTTTKLCSRFHAPAASPTSANGIVGTFTELCVAHKKEIFTKICRNFLVSPDLNSKR